VSERTSDICTFESESGLWRFRRLITGQASSPSVFQRLSEIIMTGLRPANLLIYIDDLAIVAKNKEEMMKRCKKYLIGYEEQSYEFTRKSRGCLSTKLNTWITFLNPTV
jgi:hypothetical protein